MSSVMVIPLKRTPQHYTEKVELKCWVGHAKQATKEMRLWYPRPQSSKTINNSLNVKKRVLGLLECGYKVNELQDWFRLGGSRANTNTVKANKIWADIKAIYHDRCVYCGKSSKRLTKDHVIPIAKGGSDTMGNIVPACMSCNQRKLARHLLDWEQFRKLQLSLCLFDKG